MGRSVSDGDEGEDMNPDERGTVGNTRAGPAARLAGAVAERCSSTLGFLVIALWSRLAPRRAAQRIPGRAGPVAPPA